MCFICGIVASDGPFMIQRVVISAGHFSEVKCFVNQQVATCCHPFSKGIHCVPRTGRLNATLPVLNDWCTQYTQYKLWLTAYPLSQQGWIPFQSSQMEWSFHPAWHQTPWKDLIYHIFAPECGVKKVISPDTSWWGYVRKPPWEMISQPWPCHISYSIICGPCWDLLSAPVGMLLLTLA